MKSIAITLLLLSAPLALAAQNNDYVLVKQKGGPTLGYSPTSGVKLLHVDGLTFKDLNRNGRLDVYEDWRRSYEERARDLAHQLSTEEIAGLMLYSAHQAIPMAKGKAFSVAHYGGKAYEESGADAGALTDEQKAFLKDDHLRAVLITSVESPAVAARWNNNAQAFVEGLDHGIPMNTSSDPRHESTANAEFNAGAGGQISLWPSSLGMGATFSPESVHRFGEIAAKEYRALGIATALSPQIDVGTEPRWWRYSGTFGEDVNLTTDMARAYCDGFQTSDARHTLSGKPGWGWQSVNAMVKHWYGYGAQEGGRDSHFGHGKYAVYPGNNLAMHKLPFTEGAFRLESGTEMASAVMPTYSILWHQDPTGENVGGGYSRWLIEKQLRQDAGFDGVVCTDWGITHNNSGMTYRDGGASWGAERLSVAERHYQVLRAGVDQFGGNNDSKPILKAYDIWTTENGEASARERFETSARRLLLNIFRTGLFENPYLDPQEANRIVGNPAFMREGYDMQLHSVVMLKNHLNRTLPMRRKMKVYIPMRHDAPIVSPWGQTSKDTTQSCISRKLASKYYKVVDRPEDADFALCLIKEPYLQLGYSDEDLQKGGNGYVPITLQYGDYTATKARAVSIAGGHPQENFTNRSYKDKTVRAVNYDHLQMVADTKAKMGQKPVVVIVEISKPIVLKEVEPMVDALLISFGVQHQALLDIISGKAEPSGLLPMQLPADMETVETQKEDVAHDMVPYRDADGHSYDFAYGLNWKGIISDSRTAKYGKK